MSDTEIMNTKRQPDMKRDLKAAYETVLEGSLCNMGEEAGARQYSNNVD